MTALVPIIAATNTDFDYFKELVFRSGDDSKLVRLLGPHGLYGSRPAKILVLPGGWTSVMESDRLSITAYCARRHISIYNVTKTKLDKMYQLVTEAEESRNA
jgi:hypothetical protein